MFWVFWPGQLLEKIFNFSDVELLCEYQRGCCQHYGLPHCYTRCCYSHSHGYCSRYCYYRRYYQHLITITGIVKPEVVFPRVPEPDVAIRICMYPPFSSQDTCWLFLWCIIARATRVANSDSRRECTLCCNHSTNCGAIDFKEFWQDCIE